MRFSPSKSLISSAAAAELALVSGRQVLRSSWGSTTILTPERRSLLISQRLRFLRKDIRKLRTCALAAYLKPHGTGPFLFSACAPCPPFSRQRTERRKDDDRAPLLWELVRFVRYYAPAYIFVENVPGLQTFSEQIGPFDRFVRALRRLKYEVDFGVIESRSFGVPQRRGRLVLVASRVGKVRLPSATHGPGTSNPEYATVWQWIGDLPPLNAGEIHPKVVNHRAMNLSTINLERIRATPEGGGRNDWPRRLRLPCHVKGYKGHTDVYGRMHKHMPASGLTTKCISLSNGRFGHPTQDRAISVREAACLQTFPRDFVFHGSLPAMGRQIGNAVPVLLAQRIGEWFVADAAKQSNKQAPCDQKLFMVH